MERREFIKTAAIGGAALFAGAAAARAQEQTPGTLKKALQWGMLPKEWSDKEKCELAQRCGFEGIETGVIEDLDAAHKLGELARETGVPVHSIVFGGWHAPLSSPDPAVIKEGLEGMKTALRSAHALGADTVLLVPAVVNERVRYVEAMERSRKHIPELIPLAEELKVVIAIEEVWNNFLLSPLEFAQYVDDFKSPWIRAYFDVGNVVAFGWPEDWIRTLGDRIVKVHLKDFKKDTREWVNLRDGSVNWPEVRKALGEVGYSGYMTTELSGGDEVYLKDLSQRIDLIIEGV
ncbi:MAG: sugar phosphate isomerase/epimerase [Candidatus Hydrogenedentes bacterium]|nr:sugar phosphate isomerase/epimerase [Candidatus Hydrogenedentota bacterium]